MQNDQIHVVKKRSWSAIPDDILQDKSLSLKARAVIAWMIGRPAGWILYIQHMQKILGISEATWKTIRKELESAGYYRQQRVRRNDGKIFWEKFVTDTSAPSPQNPGMDRARHGATLCRKTTAEKLGGIPPIQKHNNLPPPTFLIQQLAEESTAQQHVSLDEYIEAAFWQAIKANKPIKSAPAWKAKIRKRIQQSGPSPEDLLCHHEWKASIVDTERRQVEAAAKAAQAAAVLNSEEAKKHLQKLNQILIKPHKK